MADNRFYPFGTTYMPHLKLWSECLFYLFHYYLNRNERGEYVLRGYLGINQLADDTGISKSELIRFQTGEVNPVEAHKRTIIMLAANRGKKMTVHNDDDYFSQVIQNLPVERDHQPEIFETQEKLEYIRKHGRFKSIDEVSLILQHSFSVEPMPAKSKPVDTKILDGNMPDPDEINWDNPAELPF